MGLHTGTPDDRLALAAAGHVTGRPSVHSVHTLGQSRLRGESQSTLYIGRPDARSVGLLHRYRAVTVVNHSATKRKTPAIADNSTYLDLGVNLLNVLTVECSLTLSLSQEQDSLGRPFSIALALFATVENLARSAIENAYSHQIPTDVPHPLQSSSAVIKTDRGGHVTYCYRPAFRVVENLFCHGKSRKKKQSHLQAQRNIPIPIDIVLLKHIRHALKRNARLDEEIETEHALPDPLVPAPTRLRLRERAEQQLHELRTKSVSEGYQGVFELAQTDTAAAVRVEAVEEGAPGGQEPPQSAELVEVDRPAAVRVEHPDHHFDRVRVEGGVVAVDEGAAELFLAELAGPVFVDLQEEGPEAVAVVAVAWCPVVADRGRSSQVAGVSPIAATEVVGRIDRSVGRVSDVHSCRSLLAVEEAGRRSHSYLAEAVNRMQPAAAELAGPVGAVVVDGHPAEALMETGNGGKCGWEMELTSRATTSICTQTSRKLGDIPTYAGSASGLSPAVGSTKAAPGRTRKGASVDLVRLPHCIRPPLEAAEKEGCKCQVERRTRVGGGRGRSKQFVRTFAPHSLLLASLAKLEPSPASYSSNSLYGGRASSDEQYRSRYSIYMITEYRPATWGG
ncbi:EF-hand [Hortaea werneckii]|nr:EF-hand [Hortaea werneckii]